MALISRGGALRDSLLQALLPYPSLSRAMPQTAFNDVTVEQMERYERTRGVNARFWHLLNLPLVLHATYSPDTNVRMLMASILRALDDFARQFSGLPNARSLLAPLWTNKWTTTPELWSVVSCAYLALSFAAHGIRVLGFEREIGASKRDADIAVELSGETTLVEVEVFHRVDT